MKKLFLGLSAKPRQSFFFPPLPRAVTMSIMLLAIGTLSACGSFDKLTEGSRIDYKSSGNTKVPSLDVPPDLTQLGKDNRYVVPGAPVSASSYQTAQPGTAPVAQTAALAVGDVRIERAGTQRWLVINRPAEKVYGPVRDFWAEGGFLLVQDQENLGIMETDWAENRAKIPQDFIRSAIGKVFDNLYSTGERDKFRTRLERTGTGATEIYISHRGMVETYAAGKAAGSASSSAETVWQPRPADPELEAEFLRRLMVKLGVPEDQSKTVIAASGTVKQTSRVATVDGRPVLQIDEDFERAWRRVGLALDRTGFTVEDRNRAQGTFFVRYVEPNADKKDPGFFGKIFSRSTDAIAFLKYQISVKGQGPSTTVSVLNAQGAPETSINAQRIVQIIADDLR